MNTNTLTLDHSKTVLAFFSRPAAILAAGLGMVVAPSSPSLAAGCQPEAHINGANLSYTACNVTDVDQFREDVLFAKGLPNSGSMYCGPTSAMNWIAYIANHGFGGLAPGVGYWGPEPPTQEPRYNLMSNALTTMGLVMGTDPIGGTSGQGMYDGILAWLNLPAAAGSFIVAEDHAWGAHSPRFADMAQAAVAGGLVIPVVGWYNSVPNQPQGWIRVGGHILTMVGAQISGNNQLVHFNDPARTIDGKLYTQSAFNPNSYPVVDEWAMFGGSFRIQSHVMLNVPNAYLDQYFVIWPMHGLSAKDGTFSAFKLVLPPNESGSPQIDVQSFRSANGGRIADFSLGPDPTRVPYLVEGDNVVWQLDCRTGESRGITSIPQARHLVQDARHRLLHVLTDRELVSLDASGAVVARTTPRRPLAAIAYGEKADRLYGYEAAAGQLWSFDAGLAGAVVYPPLPTGRPAGPVSLRVDPSNGTLLLHVEGAPTVTRVTLSQTTAGRPSASFTEIRLEGARMPSGFAVDDRGNIYATDSGPTRVYDRSGHSTTTVLSPALNALGSRVVDVMHSSTFEDIRQLTGPAYRNVPPPAGNDWWW